MHLVYLTHAENTNTWKKQKIIINKDNTQSYKSVLYKDLNFKSNTEIKAQYPLIFTILSFRFAKVANVLKNKLSKYSTSKKMKIKQINLNKTKYYHFTFCITICDLCKCNIVAPSFRQHLSSFIL